VLFRLECLTALALSRERRESYFESDETDARRSSVCSALFGGFLLASSYAAGLLHQSDSFAQTSAVWTSKLTDLKKAG